MIKLNHYYFKNGKQNKVLTQLLLSGKYSLKVGNTIPISIFYGKWKVEDYELKSRKFKNIIRSKNRENQVDSFFNSTIDSRNTRYWVFYNKIVLVLKPVSGVFNDEKIDKNINLHSDSTRKSVKTKILKIIPIEELPELFSTLNCNQKYNRKTIVKLDELHTCLANYLLNRKNKKNKINLSQYDKLDLLSPVQFETLIFLIFHHYGIFCTSYRGGTLKDIDFKIYSHKKIIICKKSFKGFQNVQVKMKLINNKKSRLYTNNNTMLIHLGEDELEENILGRIWINEAIKKKEVKAWLNKSLYRF